MQIGSHRSTMVEAITPMAITSSIIELASTALTIRLFTTRVTMLSIRSSQHLKMSELGRSFDFITAEK